MLRKALLVTALGLLAPVAYAASPAAGPVILGAAANPPKGPGPGRLFVVNPAAGTTRSIAFAKPNTLAGNSFFVGYDPATETVFVPSPVGRITAIETQTHYMASFPVIRGARVARAVPQQHLLLVLSAKNLAAYALSTHKPIFTLAVGGNAIAVNATGTKAYIGGNMDQTISEVDLPSGKINRSYPIVRSGDLQFANGMLFSADIKSGVMTVLDTHTGKIVRIATKEVDSHFSYARIEKATAGFMQLARSPDGQIMYAAGFSGHILKFSTTHPRYLGEVRVNAFSGPEKLSGLAIVDHGREALVTIENHHAAAVVSTQDGKPLHLIKDVASNRWVVVHYPENHAP